MKSILRFIDFIKESAEVSEKISLALDMLHDFSDEFIASYVETEPHDNQDDLSDQVFSIRRRMLDINYGSDDTKSGVFWTKLTPTFSNGESGLLIGIGAYTLGSFLDNQDDWDKSRRIIDYVNDSILARAESIGLYTAGRGAEYDKGNYGGASKSCILVFGIFESEEMKNKCEDDSLFWDGDNMKFLGRDYENGRYQE